MLNDDSDDEDTFDVIPFIGRDKEREQVKQWIGRGHVRVVQLTGNPMTGKARLAEEISKELQDEMDAQNKKLNCYHLCLSDVSALPDLLACLSACLSMDETAETEKALFKHFQRVVNNDPKCAHLFVFLKCENVHRNSFYVQFVDIIERKVLKVSKRVFVMITTQKHFNISQSRQIKIDPLSKEDTVKLVRRYAPDTDVDPYVNAIEKHCYGLPPLAMDAAQELSNAKVPYTAEEFAELLSTENRSRRIHSGEDLLNSVALAQFEGLNEFLKKRIIDISIFKGSFRVDDILPIVGDTRTEAKKNLNEMASIGLVEYEEGGERMHLQTVIEHYIRNLMGSHVTYDDTVRLRFVTLFVDVLKKADSELFIKPQQTVFGYLHDDWPNLRQVLEEAIHCTEQTYTTFLKVALSAENLLVKCFPGEAVKFYEAMMMAATKFGTREECAMQKWLLGMAKTIGKGTDLVEAMGLFREALPVLTDSDSPEALVSLLADMGLNYNRQGKNAKSRTFYLQALEESGRCTDGRKLTNRVINIRCYLAIPMIFLEHFDEAEDLLKETLEETRKVAPYHPSIPIMINSIGLIYERAGRSDDEALRYYTNSLAERRKYADVSPGDLVVVLNNVAMQHSKRGNHDYALQLLSEAREIRMKIERINYHTALTCWDMGQVYGRKREYKHALSEITDALDIFKKCTKSHFVIVEVLLQAAHFASCLELYQEAENYLLEALKLEEKYKELNTTGCHILLVLQHLLMMFMSWKKQCSPYLDRAVAEASRLQDNRPSNSLEKNAGYWQNKAALYRVRSALDQQVVAGESLKELTDELLGFCYICEDLKSRGEDMVEVFCFMTTSVCADLKSAETLLRSQALSVAAQRLREASGASDSPPLSPTRETSDPPSYYLDNRRVMDSPGFQSPLYANTEIRHIPRHAQVLLGREITTKGLQTRHLVASQTNIGPSQMLQEQDNLWVHNIPRGQHAYDQRFLQHEPILPNGNLYQQNGLQYQRQEQVNGSKDMNITENHALPIRRQVYLFGQQGFLHNGQREDTQHRHDEYRPHPQQTYMPNEQQWLPQNNTVVYSRNNGYGYCPTSQEPHYIPPQPNGQFTNRIPVCNSDVDDMDDTLDSLGINVAMLNGPGKPEEINTSAQKCTQQIISKQKTVDEVVSLPRQQLQESCPFDQNLKYPPNHKFPKFETQFLTHRTSIQNDRDFQNDLNQGAPSTEPGEDDFHIKLASYCDALQKSKITSAPTPDPMCERGCTGSSSGYDSSAVVDVPPRHAQNRLSEGC